jgi:hypothetical protein
LAAAASSSRKLSTTKAVIECSTDRHHITRMGVLAGVYSMRTAGIA